MRYHQDLNYHKRKKFLLKAWILFLSFAVILIAAASYGYYAIISRQSSNTDNSSTSRATKSYYAPSVKVFRSPFFQLQMDDTWFELPAESTPTKFVYRSLRSNLIEQELTIYVNDIPEILTPNRVLPVNLKSESEFLPITVSEHCIKAAGGPNITSARVTLDRVTFRCDADSTDYRVMAGEVNGTTTFNLQRPDGTRAKYALYYTNLKATPDGTQFTQIVDSFQTR